jgi:ribokinase
MTKLLETGSTDAVIVTLGNKGSLLKERTRLQTFPAFEVKAKDTTAAGDAFIAGLIFSLSEGKDLRTSVQFGTKVAAYAVTVVGAQSSLPTYEQLEKFVVKLMKGGESYA